MEITPEIINDPLSDWIHNRNDLPTRSDFERESRLKFSELTTLSTLQRVFNDSVKKLAGEHKGSALSNRNMAVLGILDGILDTHLYLRDFIVYRRLAGLPDKPIETETLNETLRIVHKNNHGTKADDVREIVKMQLWDAVDHVSEVLKSKFEIREKSGDDVSDLYDGMRKGLKDFGYEKLFGKFTKKLVKLGLITREQAKSIRGIIKQKDQNERTYRLDQTITRGHIYEAVLIGGCKSYQDYLEYSKE